MSRRSAALIALLVTLAACTGETEDQEPTGGGPTSSSAASSAPPLAPPTSRAGVTPTTEPARLPCRTPRRQSGPTYEVAAKDNLFDPRCMAVRLDQGLNVVNEGDAVHNFTLQQVGADGTRTELIDFGSFEPGMNTATEAFGHQGPGAGIFRLYCKIHEAEGMESFLEVA